MTKNNPNLSAEQKLILFEEGTERPGSSELNYEKRKGNYYCANCGVKLFSSDTKYESGSGWPSFYKSLPDVFETKTDYHLGYARTEYHCKNCGVIMVISLRMVLNQLGKDTVITVYAWFLNQNKVLNLN